MLNMLKSTFAVSGPVSRVSVEIEETMDRSKVHLDSCAAFSFSRCFAALRVGGVLQNGLWDVIWMLELLLGPVGGGPLRPECMYRSRKALVCLSS